MNSAAKPKLRVLAIDDSNADALLLRALLEQSHPEDLEFVHFLASAPALQALEAEPFDCVYLDYDLGEELGPAVLGGIRDRRPEVPVIGLSGCGEEQAAIDFLKRGAQDYLVKGTLNATDVGRSLRDVLERAQLHRQIESKQQEMSSFAGTAAHDLAAPLRQIDSMAQLLAMELQGSLNERTQQYLQAIEETARGAQSLLDSLLHYSRAGRTKLDLEDIELSQVVKTALGALSSDIDSAQARIEVAELPRVRGCAVSLAQLVQNLIANALKFHGTEPPFIEIDAEQVEGSWHLRIRDHGIGFEQSKAEQIFAPFQRLHSASVYEGSGIGLATCKRIAEQHGAQLWAESTPGEGSTFFLSMPIGLAVF